MCKCFYHRLSPSRNKLEVLTMRYLVVGRRRPRRCTQSTSAMPGKKPSCVPQLPALMMLVWNSQKKHRRHPKIGLVPEVKSPRAWNPQMRGWPLSQPVPWIQEPVPELDRWGWVLVPSFDHRAAECQGKQGRPLRSLKKLSAKRHIPGTLSLSSCGLSYASKMR